MTGPDTGGFLSVPMLLTFLQGGQAQRVTLAICLALRPDFLLLDGELLLHPSEKSCLVYLARVSDGLVSLPITHLHMPSISGSYLEFFI